MSPGISPRSSRTTTGTQWYCTILDWTTLDTRVVRGGTHGAFQVHPPVLTLLSSPHMVPKQREMDGVVKQIFTAIETQPHLKSTLFVVCGDHGMNDAGNHGASSPGETSPALVFMSPKLKAIQKGLPAPVQTAEDFQYYTTVEQSDLAPTLAALLGFPVPKNNLGALIPEFLPFWSNGRIFPRLFLGTLLMENRKGPISTADAECPSNLGRHYRRLWHSDPWG